MDNIVFYVMCGASLIISIIGQYKFIRSEEYVPGVLQKIIVCLWLFVPFLNLIWLIAINKMEYENEIQEILKEDSYNTRQFKIKMGIIRFNSIDPYGEENWD